MATTGKCAWVIQRWKQWPRRRRVVMVVAMMAVVLLFLLSKRYAMQTAEWLKQVKDSYMAIMWTGFGPERGFYNFTVVTALIDIGRGNWTLQARSYNTYLLHMQRVLRLDVNLVVYVDAKGRPFVEWMRRGRENRTRVVEVQLQQLPYFRHVSRIREIMSSAQYRQENELVDKELCESRFPEYDVIQWSKVYFVQQAAERDHFYNEYYVWLDAGYGHGQDVHPHDGVWLPKGLMENADKVTFIEREPVDNYRPFADRLHKMSVNIVAGLFFGGGKRALKRLYVLQQELIADWLQLGVVDDDQTTYMLMYYKEPVLFNLVRGDWNDVFTLFNAHTSTE